MAAIDFPNSPTTGQLFTVGDITWEWTGTVWQETFDPSAVTTIQYFTNLTTGVQYKWDGTQWLRSFEGEYAAGYWRFDLDA